MVNQLEDYFLKQRKQYSGQTFSLQDLFVG